MLTQNLDTQKETQVTLDVLFYKFYLFQMKTYCGVDLAKANITVNDKKQTFGRLYLHVDLCIQAWCYSMIAKKQTEILLKYINKKQAILGK